MERFHELGVDQITLNKMIVRTKVGESFIRGKTILIVWRRPNETVFIAVKK